MKLASSTSLPGAALFSLAVLIAVPATATSYVMVADETLVDQAPVIAEVRVLAVDESAGLGEPLTEYRMEVVDVISGHVAASPLSVRVRGGLTADGMGLEIYGAPRFREGGRAVLFLRPRADGTYGILHLMLGAFHLVEVDGERYLVRDLSETREVDLPGKAPVRRGPRQLDRFRAWVSDRKQGVERPADYFVEASADGLLGELEKFTFLFSDANRPIRWTTFDSGGSVNFRAHEMGQPGLSGGGFSQFQTALAAWRNDPNTPIRVNYAGTTSATGGLTTFDSVNAILFDDIGSTSEFEDDGPFNCATGGVLAVGGPWFSGSHNHNGTVFETAVGGDIVTNKNAGCFFSEGKSAEEVFSHEVGHTLGLGHSTDTSALMFANAHGGNFGAQPRSDDLAGVRALYGVPATIPAAPTNLVAQTVSSARVDLFWSDNSSDETSFEIERRTGSGSFQQIATRGAGSVSYQDTGALSGTTYDYRVRARNSAGASGYSNTATATTVGEAAPSALTAAATSASQIRLQWQDNATSETGFQVDGKTGGGAFTLFLSVAAGTETAIISGLMPATAYAFRVRATGGAGNSSYSNEASATTFLSNTESCVPGPTTLCLNGGRFKVEVDWRDFVGQTGPGTDLGLPSSDSGLFWFFNDNNWEMLVKVLDGCAITQHFWVFAAATTDVEYELRVTDSLTGFEKIYTNGLGVASPAITDTSAFATCSAQAPLATPAGGALAAPAAAEKAAASRAASGAGKESCLPSDTRLCLGGNRFAVEIEWRDFKGVTGAARTDPFHSSDSGLMYFFSPNNVEVLVKVLDGCAFNDRFWVFAAATTNVEYTLRVTDTETGDMKPYFNPLGSAADSITDTNAFKACP